MTGEQFSSPVDEFASFSGRRQRSIDSKGRLPIPTIYRAEITEERDGRGFYITRGLDGCLYLFTPHQWRQIRLKLAERPFTKARVRRFQTIFDSWAEPVFLDKQNRIRIPARLRLKAEIKDKVILIGHIDRIAIWAKERLEAFEQEIDQEYEALAEDLF